MRESKNFNLRTMGLVICTLVASVGCSDGDPGTSDACGALKGQPFGEGTVDDAVITGATEATGAYCRVTGSIHTDLRFEVDLPTQWNKKLLFGGGGGWNGAIATTIYSPSGNAGGYVRVSSNGGHQSSAEPPQLDASFALNNPKAREDFAYLSSHATLTVAKQIVQAYYGGAPVRSYFEGCSTGGRDALMQATHFPEDYDGIVSRAPAYNFTYQQIAYLKNARHTLWTPGGALDAAALTTLTNAVLARCDALDGVEDGIISNIAACSFDPSELRCEGGGEKDCLTDAQVETVNAVYSATTLPAGRAVYAGWGFGGENDPKNGWGTWLGTSADAPGLQLLLAQSMIKYWFLEDPDADAAAFVPEDHVDRVDAAAAQLDATPELGDFFARGGKLILAHGTTDWALSYKSSVAYHEAVAAAVGGVAERDASMEFFLQPGVQHCGGGSGPDVNDLLAAAVDWVESDLRPSTKGLISEKLDEGGNPTLRRPLCRYPAFPRYNGSGDPNAAESFSCVEP